MMPVLKSSWISSPLLRRRGELRLLSSSSGASPSNSKKDESNKASKLVTRENATAFAETTLRGMGQVIFLNNPLSGGLVLGGLMVGAGSSFASLAVIGTVAANGTALLTNMDKDSYQAGLWGYNGCLVGCAMSVFGPSNLIFATTSTLIGAAASLFVAASLKEAMTIPQWTFAFNIVALSSFLRTQPLLPPAPAVETAEATTTAAVTTTTSFVDILASPFVGISQIFVVESALAGAIITGGIMNYSEGLAAHALMGSAVGSLIGITCCGADLSEVAMGLWGFNSALTSMAVGTFFVHSTPVMLLSAGGAACTSIVFGAMKTAFGAWGSPCLTLPFCTTMSACYLLHKQIPSLRLAKDPHSPEKNSPSD